MKTSLLEDGGGGISCVASASDCVIDGFDFVLAAVCVLGRSSRVFIVFCNQLW